VAISGTYSKKNAHVCHILEGAFAWFFQILASCGWLLSKLSRISKMDPHLLYELF
jgi:hypothetical protein